METENVGNNRFYHTGKNILFESGHEVNFFTAGNHHTWIAALLKACHKKYI
jgi:hypothetical protein